MILNWRTKLAFSISFCLEVVLNSILQTEGAWKEGEKCVQRTKNFTVHKKD
jgi:hypothetical protein